MTDRLYFCPGTISVAVATVLEQAGRPYEMVRVPMAPEGAGGADYADTINPLRLVPVLETARGRVREVVAILNFLADDQPQAGLLPADPLGRAEANQWLAFCASSLHPVFKTVFRAYRYVGSDEAAQANLKSHSLGLLEKSFATVERHLEGRPWLLGDSWSAVDANFGEFSNWAATRVELKTAHGPNLTRHREAHLTHPATVRAKAREKAATEAQPNPT